MTKNDHNKRANDETKKKPNKKPHNGQQKNNEE